MVAGPSLPPGDYAVEVRGVKRQRGVNPSPAQVMGEAPELAHLEYTLVWGEDQYAYRFVEDDEPAGDPDDVVLGRLSPPSRSCTPGVDVVDCVDGAISCACVELTVVGDETVELGDFVIDAPPQCDNGIDDDGDGLVDGADPACAGPSDASENEEAGTTQVTLDVSFFDRNPNVTCEAVGVATLRVATFDRTCAALDLPENAGVPPEQTTDLACVTGSALFSVAGSVGDKCLEVVAQGGGGATLTVGHRRALTIEGGPAGAVEHAVDFAAGDFLTAVARRSTITLGFDPGDGTVRSCSAPGLPDIEWVTIELLDAHGGPLPAPVVDTNGVPLDGSPRACPTGQIETAAPLVWGGYLLDVDVFGPDDTLCFATGEQPIPLPPGDFAAVIPPAGGSLSSACGG
jgi:hypothetical protein